MFSAPLLTAAVWIEEFQETFQNIPGLESEISSASDFYGCLGLIFFQFLILSR